MMQAQETAAFPFCSSADVALCRVPPGDVVRVAPVVAEMLSKAVSRTDGRDTIENVLRSAVENRTQLWVVATESGELLATLVTEIREFQDGSKTLTIAYLGGVERARWMHLLLELEEFARQDGCARVDVLGRRGWAKLLTGYTQPYVVLRKEL